MNITASSVDRALRCPASHSLPRVVSPDSEYAERGKIIHDWIRCKLSGSTLPEVPYEYKPFVDGLDLPSHVAGLAVVALEASYVLNVKEKTVKFLGTNIGRRYPDTGPYEIPLTIDLVGIKVATPVEQDWKTGNWLGQIEDNWQRRVCASALLLHYGSDEVITRNVYLREDGTSFVDETTFTMMDVYAFLDDLTRIVDRVLASRKIVSTGGVPDTYPGDWCKYCDCKAFCPSKTQLVRSFSTELDTLKERVVSLSPGQQGQTMLKAKEYEKLLKELITILKEEASDHPLPADEGYEYRSTTRPKTYFDAAEARGLLIKLGATEEQIQSLYKKSINKEIRRLKVI